MKVGLFIPCYVDAVYPNVGMACYKLLRHLGIDVEYPKGQTCCGQPMANAGYEGDASPLASRLDDLFAGYDYVVAPSVSCVAFVRLHYPDIMPKGHKCHIAGKTLDIVEFLHDIVKPTKPLGSFPHKVSIHNSCHGVRDLGLSSPTEIVEPRFNKIHDLLNLMEDIEIVEPERPDECCGFGGMFSVEELAVSKQMGWKKFQRHKDTGAQYITGADCSCLMHMAGVAAKMGIGDGIEFRHVIEILASGL
ncbi:MAG: (Fe-S)-binding protein [Clostridium sp.]|nr:(Fe-S)-binding protein [Prevotella sp.]MCM1429672.1 (Fe-S)-binding protein [Clostridium sp.]MCM1476173.1 (Fe-S)-binding protein [Muribaculaceae bacterium]